MKKVFLDNLPKRGKLINWKESINYKIKFVYDDIQGELNIINYEYKNNRSYLYVKYLDFPIYRIQPSSLSKCALGELLNKQTNEFKVEIETVFKDNKRDIIIISRQYKQDKNNRNWKYYKYKCNKCGYDQGWISESNLFKGRGCGCCKGNITAEGINDIPTTAPWMVKYFQGGYDEAKLYTKTSNKYITPVCSDCNRIKDRKIAISNIYNDKSIGCSCSDGQSYPFKLMFSVLEQLKVNFETEYSPSWCKYEIKNKIKNGRYDFYFEKDINEYIVEPDGGWHTKDNNMNGQTKEKSKEIDDYKDKLAKEHSIEVIRINSEISELEYIKNNIFNSILAKLFDLSIIDWNKAEEFAISNLVKNASEFKRNNPNMTTIEIGKIMNLHYATIIKYLKQGAMLGWCEYNPKEELRKSVSRNGKMHGKKVEILNKEGRSLGIFESCTELERLSEQVFGIKLFQSRISSVCLNQYEQYKGYIFKYI